MRTHKVCFRREIRKNIFLIPALIWSYELIRQFYQIICDLSLFMEEHTCLEVMINLMKRLFLSNTLIQLSLCAF